MCWSCTVALDARVFDGAIHASTQLCGRHTQMSTKVICSKNSPNMRCEIAAPCTSRNLPTATGSALIWRTTKALPSGRAVTAAWTKHTKNLSLAITAQNCYKKAFSDGSSDYFTTSGRTWQCDKISALATETASLAHSRENMESTRSRPARSPGERRPMISRIHLSASVIGSCRRNIWQFFEPDDVRAVVLGRVR